MPGHAKGQVKVFCPQCHDQRRNKTDKSLSVNLEERVWQCHYPPCSWSGRLFDQELLQQRKKRVYTPPAEPPPHLSEKSKKYLNSRSLSDNTIRRFKITDGMEWMPQTEKEQNCIRFPYYRNEQLVNIKYRDGAKNFKMAKDAELIFFHLDAIEGAEECVITEGEIDCMSAYEAGVYQVVSVPNGASKPGAGKAAPKLEYLDNCFEYFTVMKRIVIATDGDTAGRSLRDELARRLGRHRCVYVVYPEGTKDLNEVLLTHGKDRVKQVLSEAVAFPIEGVHTVTDFEADLDQLYLEGIKRGDQIGYPDFDKLFSFKRGQFTVVTGIPNHGKSAFLNQCLVRLSSRYGWKHAICSFEHQPVMHHAAKLISCFLGKRFDPSTINTTQWAWGKLFVDEHFYFFNTEDIELTVGSLLDKAKELVMRYGIDSFTIDPWNYIEFNLERGETETMFISRALTLITKFSRAYDVHVFLVAHPAKMSKTGKGFDIPNLYSIAGSAHFNNKTDNGITVHIDEMTGNPVVYVQKVREQPYTGVKGHSIFRFEVGTGRYAELDTSFSDEVPLYLDRKGYDYGLLADDPIKFPQDEIIF
ncbi:toprim domain-containing protein [Chitinophaga cymbidii]|uniref:toprim domain-containing protein n=1 Tax=Chitinophaga cymbidii TaxID=1096750 RepID=UPI00362B9257